MPRTSPSQADAILRARRQVRLDPDYGAPPVAYKQGAFGRQGIDYGLGRQQSIQGALGVSRAATPASRPIPSPDSITRAPDRLAPKAPSSAVDPMTMTPTAVKRPAPVKRTVRLPDGTAVECVGDTWSRPDYGAQFGASTTTQRFGFPRLRRLGIVKGRR